LKEKISLLALIDSPPPHKGLRENAKEFNLESELNFVKQYSIGGELKEKLEKANEPNQIWLLLVDYLETGHSDVEKIKQSIAKYGVQALPNYRQLNIRESIYYLNVSRTFANARVFYVPEKEVKTTVYYFGGNQSKVKNKDKWNDYTGKPVKFYKINGDHYSIFKMPGVAGFARLYDSLLDNI